MVIKVKPESFKTINRDSFINAVEALQDSLSETTLVVQQSLISVLQALFSFSQLKQTTQIENVIKCDEETVSILESLPSSTTLIFLLDIRSDLKPDVLMLNAMKALNLRQSKIIYLTHNDHEEELGLVRHYLHFSMDPIEIELKPWHFLPMETIDRNVLDCGILKNSDGMNLYYPRNPEFQLATITILLDNLTNSIVSILDREHVTIVKSIAFGENSKKLANMVQERLQARDSPEEMFIRSAKFGKLKSGERNDLIVFERNIDAVTPLMTDLTYAGILSEVGKKDSVPQDSEIWDQLKFLNFGAVGSNLNKLAKDLQSKYESRHEANTISEIKSFVDNLGGLQNTQALLKEHTVQSSELMQHLKQIDFKEKIDFEHGIYVDELDYATIINTITELMCFDSDETRTLRLCCLFAQIKQGLRTKDFNILRQELVDTFGNDMLFQLKTLEQYKLLCRRQTEHLKNYRAICKTLDTVPDVDIEPTKPRDMNYAFSGVVPIMTRLLQSLYDRSIFVKNSSSILQSFVHSREPTVDKLESTLRELDIPFEERSWMKTDGKTVGDVKGELDVTLLVFIGGITHGEISTINYLNDRLKSKNVLKHFIIVTDGIITGNDLF